MSEDKNNSGQKAETPLSQELRLKQFELVYDYIKFHMGLYLGTPPVIAILGESFDVQGSFWFRLGLGSMIAIYLVSGVSAALFMSKHINHQWKDDFLKKFENTAFEPKRRLMHHGLYWTGLFISLIGFLIAVFKRTPC